MNKQEPIIVVDHLTKSFISQNSTYSFVLNLVKKIFFKNNSTRHYVLKNISFHVQKGETFGIIGKNGSGKSTLLKIIAGVTQADSGQIKTSGRLISMLEVGAGFSGNLTGIENIFLNASLNGLCKNEIHAQLQAIVDYADLGESIHQPLSQYSSGMVVRLGFSIAVHCQPNILIIDEALAVGDINFQAKCIDKITQLKQQGCTILFVSHDLALVGGLCDRVLFLHESAAAAYGPASHVVASYLQLCGDQSSNYTLKNSELKLYFNSGNLGFMYQDRMLSKVYGLYTSIYAYKTWHDSDQISWTLLKQNDHSLELSGKMRRLPIVQKWDIKILNAHSFSIKIYLEQQQDCQWNEIQVSSMLIPEFDQWKNAQQHGSFSKVQQNWNNWTQLSQLNEQNTQTLDATNSTQKISLSFKQLAGLNTQSSVLSTSKDLNSSVLQFLYFNQNSPQNRTKPYLFFEGVIEIKSF